jgi:hypothetical protein
MKDERKNETQAAGWLLARLADAVKIASNSWVSFIRGSKRPVFTIFAREIKSNQ